MMKEIDSIKNTFLKNPTVPISLASLGIAGTNLKVNLKKSSDDKKYQRRQLKEMNQLSNNLEKVSSVLSETNKIEADKLNRLKFSNLNNKNESVTVNKKKKRSFFKLFSSSPITKRVKFRKAFSNTTDKAIDGAIIGTAIGSMLSGSRNLKQLLPISGARSGKTALMLLGTSTLVGAGLGALVGAVQDLNSYWSNRSVGNQRLTKDLLLELNRLGLEEDKDFTRSPKTANLMKTKVCIVLKGDATEFNIVINSREDKNLKNVLFKITNQFRGGYQKTTNQTSNNYNEITLTTIKDKSRNIKAVADIINKLVSEGYKVYLVEAG